MIFCSFHLVFTLYKRCTGAAATGVVFAGMATAMGHAFMTPCLTLPFCVVASVCHVLLSSGEIYGCMVAKVPVSPEVNYIAYRREEMLKDAEMDARSRFKVDRHRRINALGESHLLYSPTSTGAEVTKESGEQRENLAVELAGLTPENVPSMRRSKSNQAIRLTEGGLTSSRSALLGIDEL